MGRDMECYFPAQKLCMQGSVLAFFQTVEGGKEHDIRITLPTGPFRVCEGGKEHVA